MAHTENSKRKKFRLNEQNAHVIVTGEMDELEHPDLNDPNIFQYSGITQLVGCPFLEQKGNRVFCNDSEQICIPDSPECILRNLIDEAKEAHKYIYAGYPSYREYLKSEGWQVFRLKALEFYGNTCALDTHHTKNLNVHHKNYERLGIERMEDVIILCRECHAKFHDKVVK